MQLVREQNTLDLPSPLGFKRRIHFSTSRFYTLKSSWKINELEDIMPVLFMYLAKHLWSKVNYSQDRKASSWQLAMLTSRCVRLPAVHNGSCSKGNVSTQHLTPCSRNVELWRRRPLEQQIFEPPKHRLDGTGAIVISGLGLRPQITPLEAVSWSSLMLGNLVGRVRLSRVCLIQSSNILKPLIFHKI